MNAQSPQESRSMRLKNVLPSFLVYIALFIGTGFLSGAIVHYPINPSRYIFIGSLGAVIFTIASTITEALFNKKTFKDEGVVKIILFSLLLSIGIGMISGGAQHFDEFPIYGSYLIPLGILLAIVAYIFKSNIHLVRQQIITLALGTLLVVIPLGLGLNAYAGTITVVSHGHSRTTAQTQKDECSGDGCANMSAHSMTMKVENDGDFLMGMIPHHQEAVDSSAYLLTRTTDPELQQFLREVIDIQSREIDQMKGWHKAWFTSEYQADGKYIPMMGDMDKLQGKELEKVYIQDMIAHHKGAIDMARQIITLTSRSEIKTMAETIINTQTKEVSLLEGWLQNNYRGVLTPSPATPLMREEDDHGDGMMMHH